jgi:hypothetical protein
MTWWRWQFCPLHMSVNGTDNVRSTSASVLRLGSAIIQIWRIWTWIGILFMWISDIYDIAIIQWIQIFTSPTKEFCLSLFTNFHEEDTTAQPPSQLGGHPPRVTSSQSLTRIIVMEISTLMQECKATKAAQILHPHPTKATNTRKELVRKNKGES